MSNIKSHLPLSGDKSNSAPEIRANFAAAKAEITALELRFFDLGPTVAYTAPGDDAGSIPVTGTQVNITSHGGADDDDLALPNGTAHGHDLYIKLATRTHASDTITIEPVSANIVNSSGTTVTTIVLDALNEYVNVVWDAAASKWRIKSTTATVNT